MIPASPLLFISLLFGAALRALAAAAAVWIGFRALRIANVLAQKVAWILVLAASLVMPFAPRWHVLPAWAALRLPSAVSILINKNAGALSTPVSLSPALPIESPVQSPVQPSSAFAGASTGVIRGSRSKALSSLPATPIENSRISTLDEQSSNQGVSSSTDRQPGAPIHPVIPGTASNRTALFAVLFYFAIASVLFLRLLAATLTAIRLWITANSVTAPAIGQASTPVRASDRVSSPVNIGSGILLPADYADWDDEKLRIVLAHERSHIRQGDFYLQLLAGLYVCAFWFSPLGWWLKRKLHELGEAISDRAGLEKAASRASYAQLLLEFAALPRPTLTGVAMARTNHLSQRIERLLDESHFRRAFAAAGRRAWLAAVLVPLVLFAATTLVSVQAATSGTQTTTLSAASGQSTPEQVTSQAPEVAPAPSAAPEAQAAPAPEAVPPPPAGQPAPEAMPAPPAFAVQPGPVPAPVAPVVNMPPPPPQPPLSVMPRFSSGFYVNPGQLDADTERLAQRAEFAADMMVAKAQQYLYRAYDQTSDTDPYALVDTDGKIVRPRNDVFPNGVSSESIAKARAMAHGAFLWFEHDGKPYIVDDPAIVAQIQAMDRPMDQLRTQMQALGKQMRDLGDQQRDLGRKMHEISVPTPDLSHEIADLNTAAANLKAKEGGSISQKDLADMQREIGRIQGQLGQLQGRIGAQQGDLGGQMGKFGSQMGALGGQMGQLGAMMGTIARENQAKIKGIMTDSLSNGKAKPVQ